MTRKRAGRRYSGAELDRFLRHLAQTGNLTVSAEAIGRSVRGIQALRKRDGSFKARCDLAMAEFEAGARLVTRGREWVVFRRGVGGSPQVRRARPGAYTDAKLAHFLRGLRATANIGLAAQSAGLSRPGIDKLRKRDVDFDEQVLQALKQGVANLETQLLDSSAGSPGTRTTRRGSTSPTSLAGPPRQSSRR